MGKFLIALFNDTFKAVYPHVGLSKIYVNNKTFIVTCLEAEIDIRLVPQHLFTYSNCVFWRAV